MDSTTTTFEVTNDIYSTGAAGPAPAPATSTSVVASTAAAAAAVKIAAPPRPPKTASMLSALSQEGYASDASDGMYAEYSVDEDDDDDKNKCAGNGDGDGAGDDVTPPNGDGNDAAHAMNINPAVAVLRRGASADTKSDRRMRGRSGALATNPTTHRLPLSGSDGSVGDGVPEELGASDESDGESDGNYAEIDPIATQAENVVKKASELEASQ